MQRENNKATNSPPSWQGTPLDATLGGTNAESRVKSLVDDMVDIDAAGKYDEDTANMLYARLCLKSYSGSIAAVLRENPYCLVTGSPTSVADSRVAWVSLLNTPEPGDDIDSELVSSIYNMIEDVNDGRLADLDSYLDWIEDHPDEFACLLSLRAQKLLGWKEQVQEEDEIHDCCGTKQFLSALDENQALRSLAYSRWLSKQAVQLLSRVTEVGSTAALCDVLSTTTDCRKCGSVSYSELLLLLQAVFRDLEGWDAVIMSFGLVNDVGMVLRDGDAFEPEQWKDACAAATNGQIRTCPQEVVVPYSRKERITDLVQHVKRNGPEGAWKTVEASLREQHKYLCSTTLLLEGHTFGEVSRHNQTPNLPKLRKIVTTDCGIQLAPPPRTQRRYLDRSSSNALDITVSKSKYKLLKDEAGELRLRKSGKGRGCLSYFAKTHWKASVTAAVAKIEIGNDEPLFEIQSLTERSETPQILEYLLGSHNCEAIAFALHYIRHSLKYHFDSGAASFLKAVDAREQGERTRVYLDSILPAHVFESFIVYTDETSFYLNIGCSDAKVLKVVRENNSLHCELVDSPTTLKLATIVNCKENRVYIG